MQAVNFTRCKTVMEQRYTFRKELIKSNNSFKYVLHSVRMRTEMKILADAIKLVRQGVNIFKSLKKKNKEINRLINMGEYMT